MTDAARLGRGGGRIPWERVPVAVRHGIERAAGGRVVEAETQPGGFSPGLAARVRLDSGRRAFVKAAATSVAAAFHRREAGIAAALPMGVPAPRLLFTYDDGQWVALGFEDVAGRAPRLPWTPEELARVLAAVDELGATLTPSPVDAPRAGPVVAKLFSGWASLAADAGRLASVDPWARRHLPRLVAMERAAPGAAAGDTLVHFDLRADNVLLTPDRVVIVDWPHARVGARWLDRLMMLPSVAVQGGPPPWELLPDDVAPAGEVTAIVCGLAGYFIGMSLQPPPDGIPHLREAQALQGAQTLAWLRRRAGWA